MTQTNDVKSKIEEILERTCGFECSNGAEENKPALPELLALYTEMVEEGLRGFVTNLIENYATATDGDTVFIKFTKKSVEQYLTQRKETLPVEDKR